MATSKLVIITTSITLLVYSYTLSNTIYKKRVYLEIITKNNNLLSFKIITVYNLLLTTIC